MASSQRIDRVLRVLSAIPFGLSILFFLVGGIVGARVSEDYKDSPDAVYILVGFLFLAIGAILLVTTGLLFTYARAPFVWLMLAAVSATSAAVPYTILVGPPGIFLNTLTALVALLSLMKYLMTRQTRA